MIDAERPAHCGWCHLWTGGPLPVLPPPLSAPRVWKLASCSCCCAFPCLFQSFPPRAPPLNNGFYSSGTLTQNKPFLTLRLGMYTGREKKLVQGVYGSVLVHVGSYPWSHARHVTHSLLFGYSLPGLLTSSDKNYRIGLERWFSG